MENTNPTYFNIERDFIANRTFSIDEGDFFETYDETIFTVPNLTPKDNVDLNLESSLSSGDSFEMDTLQTPVRIEEDSLEDDDPVDPSNNITTMEPQIDFEIVKTGSQRRGALLIETCGFKYTIKFKGKVITRWTCSKRSKLHTCKATVIQTGSTFKPRMLFQSIN